MITVEAKGDFSKTETFFNRLKGANFLSVLNRYGAAGVNALSSATPKDSGETASSWTYSVLKTVSGYELQWQNSNVNKGVNVAVILQYGHGTRNGGYVQGIDYVNPAMRPIFDKIAEEAWKAVKSI